MDFITAQLLKVSESGEEVAGARVDIKTLPNETLYRAVPFAEGQEFQVVAQMADQMKSRQKTTQN